MSLIGTLVVSVVGDNKALKKSLADSNKQLSGFGAAVQKHSATFMKTGAVMMGFAGAIGIAAVKVGKEFDAAYSKIRTGTGKTGKVLEGLKKDFRAVAKDVPNSLDEVSTAIAEINTRLGLTGKPLQVMAKQMLNLARITKTDVNAVIRTSTRLFGDWGVEVEDQAETLDYLYKVSQSTGIGIDRLSDLTTTYGVQLRTVGFTMEESLALMGKWEKEGVSAEKMLGGLSMALGKFAKAQKEPEEAMRRLMEQIEKAPTVGKAMEIGVEALGTRAGPDFALAVREGRFAVEDFVAELAGSSETINQAAEDTMTLTEKFNQLKNQAKLAVEPLAKKLMDELMPALEKATDWLSNLDEKTLDNIASNVLWATKILAIGGAFIFAMGAVGKFSGAIKIATGFMATFHATALGPWGILAAAIAGTTLLTGDAIEELTDLTEDQTKALNEAADAVDELIPPHRNLAGAENDVREAMGELYAIAREYPQICDEITDKMLSLSESYKTGDITIEEFALGMGDLKEGYEDLHDPILGMRNSLLSQADATEIATEADEANAAALAELKRQLDANEISQEEYEAAVMAAKGATEDQTGAFEDDEEAAENLADEIDGLRSSFNKLLGVLFDGIDASNNLQEAEWKVADVEEELQKLRDEGKEGTREYEEKVNDLESANQDLISSQYEVYTSTYTTKEEQEKAKEEALKYGRQLVETGAWGEESFIDLEKQFGTTAEGITTDIYGPGGIILGYQDMYDKGTELDEQKIEPEIIAVTEEAMSNLDKFKAKMDSIQSKEVTLTFKGKQIGLMGVSGGGLIGFAEGGIAGSDGFSLPVLTAAQGLSLPRADDGMLAVLHPPELVLNPEQALKVLWRIANEPAGAKSSPPDYGQDNRPIEIRNIIELDGRVIYEKTSEFLYDQQQTNQRGIGEK